MCGLGRKDTLFAPRIMNLFQLIIGLGDEKWGKGFPLASGEAGKTAALRLSTNNR